MISRASTFIAVAALASCAAPSRSPPVPTDSERTIALQRATEDAVANYIYAQLNADPIYYYRHVDVRVDNGVADLSGYVWSADAIYQARRIAMNIPGITAVRTGHLLLERNGQNSGPAR